MAIITCECDRVHNVGHGVVKFRCKTCGMVHIVDEAPRTTVSHKANNAIVSHKPKRWPLWALALWLVRSRDDSGVGDTVHRLLGRAGRWYKSRNKDCGCDRRRTRWNLQYRY